MTQQYHAPLPAKITEAGFQRIVVDYARIRGWRVHHTRPALRQSGKWSTPIQGDAGFPDLVLARRGQVLFAELKTAKGRVTPEQQLWLEALSPLKWTNWRLWRPVDWPEIQETLD